MYKRPLILLNDDLAEGVYADGSGADSDCYTTTARIHQTPQPGREDYRIQVDAKHDADHNSANHQQLVLSFNQAVVYSSSNGTYISGNNTTSLTIDYYYWNNHKDNIGLGDVVVTSGEGLAVTGAVLHDLAKQY